MPEHVLTGKNSPGKANAFLQGVLIFLCFKRVLWQEIMTDGIQMDANTRRTLASFSFLWWNGMLIQTMMCYWKYIVFLNVYVKRIPPLLFLNTPIVLALLNTEKNETRYWIFILKRLISVIAVGLPWPAATVAWVYLTLFSSALTPWQAVALSYIRLRSGAPSPAAGLSWALPEPSGTFQNPLEPCRMFLNLLELPGTLWNVPEPAGTLGFHLEPSASLWNFPELSEGGRGSLCLSSQRHCHMRAWSGRALTDILVSLCPTAFKNDLF